MVVVSTFLLFSLMTLVYLQVKLTVPTWSRGSFVSHGLLGFLAAGTVQSLPRVHDHSQPCRAHEFQDRSFRLPTRRRGCHVEKVWRFVNADRK